MKKDLGLATEDLALAIARESGFIGAKRSKNSVNTSLWEVKKRSYECKRNEFSGLYCVNTKDYVEMKIQ